MRKIITAVVLLMLAMGLAGCASGQNVQPAANKPVVTQATETEQVKDTNQMSLSEKTWTWVSAKKEDGTTLTPNKPDVFTLTFDGEGRVEIGTDCNHMGGDYVAENNSLTFGTLMTTLMYCEGSQETEFAAIIATVSGFRFTEEGELILFSEKEQDLMKFR